MTCAILLTLLLMIVLGMAVYEMYKDGVFSRLTYWWKTRT